VVSRLPLCVDTCSWSCLPIGLWLLAYAEGCMCKSTCPTGIRFVEDHARDVVCVETVLPFGVCGAQTVARFIDGKGLVIASGRSCHIRALLGQCSSCQRLSSNGSWLCLLFESISVVPPVDTGRSRHRPRRASRSQTAATSFVSMCFDDFNPDHQ